MSTEAVDHLPADHFVFATTNISTNSGPPSGLFEHVPPQGEPHLPSEVPPPVNLPDAAHHMSDTGGSHLPGHLDWLV
jgi:hypothetical protein